MNENESLTVTLTLDNDEQLECSVLMIFDDEESDLQYIALAPLDKNGEEDGQVFLYRFIDNGEDEEPGIENIQSEEEFNHVSALFDEIADEEFGDIDLDDLDDLED